MLKISNLTYRIGERVLLDQVSAAIHPGAKVGLVGRNGTGKTTLFRLITGKIQADGGTIDVPGRWRIGVTTQDAPNGPESLIDTVIAADRELAALWEESETATDPDRIAEIHEILNRRDARRAPARAAQILAGLGFDEATQQRPCDSFSGGWRMRVALASLLFTNPDLLLLDEPTNHLDLEAVLWFEDFIARYEGTVLLISHDRELLNVAVDQIVHLEAATLTTYRGNYDQFERTRRLQMEMNAKQHAKQAAQRAHMESFVARFRAKASKAKQAQSRLKMLARMEPLSETLEERAPSFMFPEIAELPPPLYSLERVNVGYDGEAVLKNVTLSLDNDDRVALLGANGNGKSTFIKLLAGALTPISGEVVKSSKLRIGYFSQDLTDQLDLAMSPVAAIASKRPEDTPEAVRHHLGFFGFSRDMALGTIGQLSGGERARLLFAQIALAKPHILLLDEPTNHLDMVSREALIQAINGFPGAVVLVSHDPHLLELTVDRFWLVADNRVRTFDGDMADYRSLLLSQKRTPQPADDGSDTGSAKGSAPVNKKDKRRLAAEQRQSLTKLRKAARAAEAELTRLTEEKTAMLERLKDPEFYRDRPDEALDLQRTVGLLQKDLDAAESRWLDRQEALDNAAG
ncbi:MAG: ABC-F family ATP-binding cassette domain-containing protein [Proteobacteria bacterium]|nr:ABC-F family ATP-binding cassette domain-containing protein [Pseudomonadota bacterium]